MRVNIDTPEVQTNEIPPDLNRWFTNIVDQINFMFGNVIAERSEDIGGAGAGPINIPVNGMTAESIVTASIQSSSNPVSIQKVTAKITAGMGGFDILFDADPGASCFINYIVWIGPWEAQGV